MKKSQIITQIILNTGLAKSLIEANKIFVQTFVDHYLRWNLQKWDTEVPLEIAHSFIQNPGTAQEMGVKFLIKDLDTRVRKSNNQASKSLLARLTEISIFR